jgi:peptidoglycan/LPS O-acetylase OafA/YrhL
MNLKRLKMSDKMMLYVTVVVVAIVVGCCVYWGAQEMQTNPFETGVVAVCGTIVAIAVVLAIL